MSLTFQWHALLNHRAVWYYHLSSCTRDWFNVSIFSYIVRFVFDIGFVKYVLWCVIVGFFPIHLSKKLPFYLIYLIALCIATVENKYLNTYLSIYLITLCIDNVIKQPITFKYNTSFINMYTFKWSAFIYKVKLIAVGSASHPVNQ